MKNQQAWQTPSPPFTGKSSASAPEAPPAAGARYSRPSRSHNNPWHPVRSIGKRFVPRLWSGRVRTGNPRSAPAVNGCTAPLAA